MKAIVLDAGQPESCQPLTCARPLAACPVGNRPLAEARRAWLAAGGFGAADDTGEGGLFLRGDAWLPLPLLRALARAQGTVAVRDAEGTLLAWMGRSASAVLAAPDFPGAGEAFRIRHPWDLLRVQAAYLAEFAPARVEGEVSPAAHVGGPLALGPGSRLLPGTVVEGPAVIGAGSVIGPNCYLRGPVSIGDGCRVGQAVEIKNSIVMNGARLCHLTYCGDSIVGEGANLGAGTITANARHDGRTHRTLLAGRVAETGLARLGAVFGDGVHTGIHTGVYPGRKLWPGTWTRPGDIVRADLKA